MIKAENLTKIFDGVTALDALNCSISEGCIYGLVGSNGAGKSTFLRLVTGVYRPDQGQITIDGKPVYDNPAAKEKIAYVPDELFFLNGASMNRMAKLYQGIYPNFDRERYGFLTKTFELDPGRSLNTFSKGMRRQAAIILALSCRPKYMFFDETFDGLDPVMRNLVKTLIVQDVLEDKATAIITSHSLRELEDTCDQLALLHKGGVILESDIVNLKTSLFKIQVAFDGPHAKEKLAEIPCMHFSQRGSVITMIVKGDKMRLTEQVAALDPLILDILPLTLEEVFTYELEARGYAFDLTGDVTFKGGAVHE